MSEKQPKLKFEEEKERTATRSLRKSLKWSRRCPKEKLKLDADKAAEKAQHLRFGKAELTPDELSRLSKAQKREMYAAHAARSAVHREVDQYEDDNVGTQALSEGEKRQEMSGTFPKAAMPGSSRKAKTQGKKGSKTARSSAQEPTAAQDAGTSGTGEGGSTGFPGGGRNRTSDRATMPPPDRARRRRPQAAKRHPTVHLPPGPAWNRRWRKAKLPSAPP